MNAFTRPSPDAVASLRARLADGGWRPVAVYNCNAAVESPGKAPKGVQWQVRARREPPDAATAAPEPDAMNTGLLCDGLRAIDVDVDDRETAAIVRAHAIKRFGETIIRHRANSGRCLLVYRAAEGSPAKRVLAGRLGKIEVLGHGQQFVAFGGHPSGALLQWHPDAPDTVTMDTLPAITEAAISAFIAAMATVIEAQNPAQHELPEQQHQPSAHGPSADSLDVVAALAVIPNDEPADWNFFSRIGLATFAATGGSTAGFAAWCAWSERHPAHDPALCSERWTHYRASPPNKSGAGTLFYLAKEARPGWKKPGSAANDKPRPDAAGGQPAPDAEPWQRYLLRDERGQVIPNLANAALALRDAAELRGIVRYDDMARHALLRRRVPGLQTPAFTGERPLQDADVGSIQEWMQHHELRRVGRDTANQAVDLVAREDAFHPVRDYLRALRWDGKPRLDTWLSYYLGADHSAYTAGIGRMFFISMAARIMQPGCKCDYMLILEGPQGSRKSSACGIIGGRWFSDGLPELHNGDHVRLSMHLRNKWIIEIAELSSISKAEAGALKSFLTQREERYLPKYARNEVIEPRQCVFIGTTNKKAYLKDDTGGRRFWPVKVTTIDTDALAHDRDQLFAEAVAAFDAGEPWWPDGEFEREHIAPQQEARFEADAWETTIGVWLAGKARCTVSEVARDALHFDVSRIGTADQRRITAALERLGWEQKRDMNGRWWQSPAA